MKVTVRSWPMIAALVGVALVVVGCGSPLWQRDQYMVEGALLGTTCQLSIDGRPYAGDPGLGEKIRFAPQTNRPPWLVVTALVCRGMVLEFLSPQGTRPAPGRYHIADGTIGRDTGSVGLSIHYSGVKAGPWPFAFTGVHLEGKSGELQLDEMTDSTARATFHAIVRRQPNGE